MNILVEGPDGCGKSTLIKKILKEFKDLTLWHLTNKTPDTIEGIKFYDDKVNCIFDRGILSTYVYSKVFGDTKIPPKEDIQYVLNKMNVIIFCLPSNKQNYLKHFEKIKSYRKEEYTNMSLVYDEFQKLFNYCFVEYKECWNLDILTPGLDSTKFILKQLKNLRCF